jgi:hypothetical protein
MSSNPTINLLLHPKQATALRTPATEVLFGGAAGGGKSHLMRVAAIQWCSSVVGLQVYLFRRLFPDLVKNHMEGPKGFRALLAPWVAAGFVEIVEEEIRFWNGSRIFLCHCKDEKDRYKYQGAEIHVLLVDELTHFTEVIYRFLRSRVRAVGLTDTAKHRIPRILCASNPGNVGHQWVKGSFVDGGPMQLRRMPEDEGGMLRQYIPSRLDDNPSMLSDDPTYRARLRGAGSSALVKALEEGDWNVIEGAFFDLWSTEKHVVKPFPIPDHWVRLRSFDWGYGAPFSVGWWTIASEDSGSSYGGYLGQHDADCRDAGENVGQLGLAIDAQEHRARRGHAYVIPRGALIRYREWYGASAPNVGIRLEAEDIGRGILEREIIGEDDRGQPIREQISAAVADTQIFAQEGQAYGYKGPTIGERLNRTIAAGKGMIFRGADKSRKQGWDQMRARLRGDLDGNPMLVVFDTCTDFIRTVPVLQHDVLKPEDLDTDSEDHIADEARYACMARPWAAPTPKLPGPVVNTAIPTLADLVKATARRRANRVERI